MVHPVTGKNYVKAGDAGIFVYDGTYFQLIGTSGGGHVIVDQDGTSMTQEDAMQFADAFVSDDSLNGRTVVENVKEVASADYSSETEDGMYLIPDGEGAVIEPASDDKVEVTADGVKTWGTLLSELYNAVDSNKLKLSSQIELVVGSYKAMYYVQNISSSEYVFVNIGDRTTKVRTTTMVLSSTSSIYDVYEGTNNPLTNNSPDNGTKITLYYGNKKATVDLQTTANRCWMSDGQSVESALTTKNIISDYSVTGLNSLFQMGNLIQASIEVTPSTIAHGTMIISKLPKTKIPLCMSVGMANGQTLPVYLDNNGDHAELIMYYPAGQTPARIDATFTYLTA